MKKNNGFGAIIAVFGIVLFVLILLFTLIPFSKNAASWISFSFTVVSFAAGLAITKFAFKGEESLKSKIYGVPVLRIGILYPCAQTALCVIFSILGAFADVPYWLALLLSIILLAAAAIGVIATSAVKEFVEKSEEEVKNATKKVKLFKLNISSVADVCKDEVLKKELIKLSDAFRYSDPVSCDETSEIENRIAEEIENLRLLVEKNDVEETSEKIQKISNMLSERNRLCKAFK